MLVNSIRVYQLSGSPSNVVGEAQGNSNLTGAGGAVAVGDRPNGGRRSGDLRLRALAMGVLMGISVVFVGSI